jgi:hypothetical protein
MIDAGNDYSESPATAAEARRRFSLMRDKALPSTSALASEVCGKTFLVETHQYVDIKFNIGRTRLFHQLRSA